MWGAVGWSGTMVLNLVTTIITARLLAPEIFGLVAVVMVLVAAAQIFADSGIKAALVQEEEDLDDSIATAMLVIPIVGLAAGAVLFAASPLIADFYGDERIQPVAMVLSGLLLVQALSIVPDALLQRRMDLKLRRGVVDPLAVIAYAAVAISLALLGAEQWALVAGQYALFVTITVGALLIARPNPFRGRASVATWRKMARYGRPLLGANILEVIDQQVEPIAIGRNVGVSGVALYNVGFRLALLPLSGITYVAAQALFPALSRVRHDAARFREALLTTVGLLPLLSIPACITLAGLGEPAVVTLFGERWRMSGVVLQILVFWTLGLSLSELGREVFKAAGRTSFVARNAFLEAGTLVALVAGLWIFGQVGLVSVALARLAVAVVALAAVAEALPGVAGVSRSDLWRRVRPAVIAGLAQWVVLFALVNVLLDDFETWTDVGGIPLGPIIPLILLAVLTAVGLAVFALAAEMVQRGVLKDAYREIRRAVGRDEEEGGDEGGDGPDAGAEVPVVGPPPPYDPSRTGAAAVLATEPTPSPVGRRELVNAAIGVGGFLALAAVMLVLTDRLALSIANSVAPGMAVLALGLGVPIVYGMMRYTAAGVLAWIVVGLLSASLTQLPGERVLWAALALGWIVSVITGRRQVRLGLIEGLMLAYLALLIVSALGNHQFPVAEIFPPMSLILTSALIPFTLFMIARSTIVDQRHITAFLWTMVAVGFYLAMMNIFQRTGLTGLVFPREILDPGLGINPERARGPLLNSAVDGVVLTIGFIAALFVASRPEFAYRRLALIAAVPMPIGIFLTQTRAVWLGAGLVVVLAAMFGRGFRVWYIAVAVVAVAFVGANWQSFLSEDRSAGGVASTSEIESRLNDIATLRAAIADRPVSGWGISRYPEVNTHRHEAWGEIKWTAGFGFIGHNTPLVIAAELGLLGLAVWLGVLVALVVALGRAWRQLARGDLWTRSFIFSTWLVLMVWFVNSLVIDMRVFAVVNGIVLVWAGIAMGIADRAAAHGAARASETRREEMAAVAADADR
jgi:O-antigen/teichoic acid export membrane protein